MSALGTHHLADFYGVEASALRDDSRLMALLRSALDEAGFHVLQSFCYRFPGGGQGVTGMFLLSESHLAFHTYPEFGYLALDLFSCGNARPERVIERAIEVLVPSAVELSEEPRGREIARAAATAATAAPARDGLPGFAALDPTSDPNSASN